jgi:hypothetical protein
MRDICRAECGGLHACMAVVGAFGSVCCLNSNLAARSSVHWCEVATGGTLFKT